MTARFDPQVDAAIRQEPTADRGVGLLRGSLALATGTVIYQGCRLGLGLVAAAVLGPTAFGLWVLLLLIVQYSSTLSLGLVNGAGRDIPFLRGAGRYGHAARVEDVALAGTLGAAVAAAAVGLGAGAALIPADVPDRTLAILVFAAVLSVQQLVLLQQIILRSSFRFGAAAAQLTASGLVLAVVGIALLGMGLVGLLTALAASSVAGYVAGRHGAARRSLPRWDLSVARGLVSVGLPILLAGLLFALITTLDRWLVLSLLGLEAVGVYGLVGMFASGLLLIPSILGQQFYPSLAFAHGAGGSGGELLSAASRQGRLTATLVAALGLPAAIVGLLAIPTFLPSYSEAPLPIAIVFLGVLAYALSSGYGNLLNTIGAHRSYLSMQLVALILDMALAALALVGGVRLVGVAVAFTVTMAVYSLLLAAAARRVGTRLGQARMDGSR